MKQLITYQKAKKDLLILKHYIDLIENYDEFNSLHNWIIKNYALYNSISKVIQASKTRNFPFDKSILTRELIKNTILKKEENDELHQILRSAYIKRYYN